MAGSFGGKLEVAAISNDNRRTGAHRQPSARLLASGLLRDVHAPAPPASPAAAGPVHLGGAVSGRTAAPVPPGVAPPGDGRRPAAAGRLPHVRPARNSDPAPELRRRVAGVPQRLPAPAQPPDRQAAGEHRAAEVPVPRLGVQRGRSAPGRSRTPRRSARGTARTPACSGSASRRAANSCSSTSATTRCRCASGSARCGMCGRADYGGAYRHAATWEKDFPCNWKVVLENSLESYHIPQVHPKTFKEFPEEANAWHELTERFTSFKTVPPRDFATRGQDWIVRRLGEPVTNEYWHRVLHPHATGSSLDSFRMMQCVFPTGPTTCRYRMHLLHAPRQPAEPAGVGSLPVAAVGSPRWSRRRCSRRTGRSTRESSGDWRRARTAGVIGTREERVYEFQKFVQRLCSRSTELPQLLAASLPGDSGARVGVDGQPSAAT